MKKGFAYKSFEWDCYNCCCRVCTGESCSHKTMYGLYRFRCAKCVRSDDMGRLLECDDFQSKYTVPRKFRIKRRFRRKGEIEKRLDALMEHFSIDLPEEP